jgi:hypothetical protein
VRLDRLPEALHNRGVTFRMVAGAETRGAEFSVLPRAVLMHWTAGPAGYAPSLGVCTFGRGGANPVKGPLCQLLQSREPDPWELDVVYVVALGIANHAGAGSWRGISGNSRSTGLEIEWSGPNERFHGVRRRRETSIRCLRALLDVSAP